MHRALQRNGALDATFGNGGKVLTNVADNGGQRLRHRGATRTARSWWRAPASSSSPTPALPLQRQWRADITFGTDGIAAPFITLNGNVANALAIQPDGKLVIVAQC